MPPQRARSQFSVAPTSPGFTLIELLLVMGIIGVLASIVLVAVGPLRVLTKSRDANRLHAAQQLQNALAQYVTDGNAVPAGQIYAGPEGARPICRTGVTGDASCVDLSVLAPLYLASIPTDPREPCGNHSGYEVYADKGRYLVVPHVLGEPSGSDVCLWQGLVGYWNFFDTTGNVAQDFSGKANTATLRGGVSSIDGKIGKALDFDGVDDFVEIPASASLSFNGSAESIALWVRHTNNYIFFQNDGWSRRLFDYYWVVIDTGGAYTTLYATGSNDGQWHLVAYTLGNGILRSYVDGTLIDTKTITSPLKPTTMDWWFGHLCSGSCNLYYRGSIDDVRLYNRELSSAEVLSLARGLH